MTFLRFAAFYTLICLSTAHHTNVNLPVPGDLKNRLFSGSRNGPIAQFFRQNRTSLAALDAMQNHMRNISDLLDDLIRNKRPYGKGPDDDVCNRRQEFAERAVRGKLRSLGLPPVAARCITEVDMELNDQQQSSLWRDKLGFVEASRLAGLSAVKKMNRTNWNGKAYPHAHFSYSDHIDSCQLLHNVGFRVSGQWAIMLSVSQFPMWLQRRDRRREYHVEYLTLTNGTVGNVLVSLPRFSDGMLVNDTTTTWENWRGSPASSIFRTVAPLSENPAIAAALQEKGEWREQVEDSRTVSNVSILTLSCLFTLLPLASFADVSLLELGVYTIATDIVTCVPLAIKGVELLLANRGDYTCISDNYWLGQNTPCITYGLRGIVYFHVNIVCAGSDLHSGVHGGAVYEGMTELFHMFSSMVTPKGDILIPGVNDDVLPLTEEEEATYENIDFDLNTYKQELGVTKLAHLTKAKVLQHRWRYPSLSIHGIEGAFSDPGDKTVIPYNIIGKFSIRLVPNMNPQKTVAQVKAHIHSVHASTGSENQVSVLATTAAGSWLGDVTDANYTAGEQATLTVHGKNPDLTREGGSIPIVLTLQEATGASVMLLPIGSSDDGAHSQNEKLNRANYLNGMKLLASYLDEVSKLALAKGKKL